MELYMALLLHCGKKMVDKWKTEDITEKELDSKIGFLTAVITGTFVKVRRNRYILIIDEEEE